jgi:hypothetical protein
LLLALTASMLACHLLCDRWSINRSCHRSPGTTPAFGDKG